jgi:hypothetical protein
MTLRIGKLSIILFTLIENKFVYCQSRITVVYEALVKNYIFNILSAFERVSFEIPKSKFLAHLHVL